MESPSQERLSEEDLEKWERVMRPRSDSTSTVVLILIAEVKRLQAIEARYKQTLELIASMEPRPAMARAKAKHALKGAVNHE